LTGKQLCYKLFTMVNKIKKDTLLTVVAEWIEESEVPPLIPRQCPDIGLEPVSYTHLTLPTSDLV